MLKPRSSAHFWQSCNLFWLESSLQLYFHGIVLGSRPPEIVQPLFQRCRFLLKAEDLSLWFYSGGTWRWGRDEALSEVVDMAMLDASHASRAAVPLASDGHALFPVQTDGSHEDMV